MDRVILDIKVLGNNVFFFFLQSFEGYNFFFWSVVKKESWEESFDYEGICIFIQSFLNYFYSFYEI